MIWLPEEKRKGWRSYLKKTSLTRGTDIQIQEAQRVPNKTNPKRTTPRHITIKEPKAEDKERIFKAARE